MSGRHPIKKKSKSGFSIPMFPMTMLKVHQSILDYYEIYGEYPNTGTLSEFMDFHNKSIWHYFRHLRSLGFINYKPFQTPMRMEVIITKNAEEIARKIYYSEGLVFVERENGKVYLLNAHKNKQGKWFVKIRAGYKYLKPQDIELDYTKNYRID